MRNMLGASFFNRSTLRVAEDLLGKFLVRRYRGKTAAYLVTEVEAYDGFKDRGSHASRGRTGRNAPMFGEAGRWYVYFTYGMHWMLNVVTRERGYPAAVLIRGVQGVSGPARITKKLKINGRLNGMPLNRASGLWIEDRGVNIPRRAMSRSARVGIAYAGPYWSRKKWRFSTRI